MTVTRAQARASTEKAVACRLLRQTMVWTIPALAAASALAASLKRPDPSARVDETDVDATPEDADVDAD